MTVRVALILRFGSFLKPSRLNKVLGLSIGERSMMVAEVVAGDRPEVKRLAEMVYPDGVSAQDAGPLGAALGEFLREQKFSAKSAVVGLPARWLVVKSKDVPPADPGTLADLLRLQAEGEFSSELKDLVYDYAADTTDGQPRCVLLVATSRKYIDAAVAMCDAARLTAVAVTPSAVALGSATGRAAGSVNPLVLAVSPAGAELTAQSGLVSNAIRHLRGPGPDRPFVGELRRAISGMPVATGAGQNGTPRELVLWDAAGGSAFDSATLSENLGMPVRTGDLPILGVDTTGSASNGDGRKYAAAVALALTGLSPDRYAVDFLHSRLAPVAKRAVPHWVILTTLATIALIGAVFYGYTDLRARQAKLDKVNTQINSVAGEKKQAEAFVTTVSFAQAWHLGIPRYDVCFRDLSAAIPQDGQTYAMSLNLRETVPVATNAGTSAPVKPPTVHTLACRLEGKTTDQAHVQKVLDQLKATPKLFTDVEDAGRQYAGRGREVVFSITFTYIPQK